MAAASAWRKGRSPTGDELWSLGKGLAGVFSAGVLIVFLFTHSNSDLGGQAVALSIAAVVLMVSAFVTLTRSVRDLLSQDVAPVTPTSASTGIRVADESSRAAGSPCEVDAADAGAQLETALPENRNEKR
jgi:drug/metabolite transporter (DMT)-like permease